MKPRLTEAGFKEAAKSLGVDIPSIKAVAEVESRGAGFLEDGRPRILFERHKFHKYTQGLFSVDHPDISNPKPGGYSKGRTQEIIGQREHERFEKAYAFDPVAAMKSASWGKFQIMGFNYEAAGFRSVHDFVEAMKVSEDEQLKAFVNFVKSNGLTDKLKRRDWAGFARGYNGADYKINQYDTKLASAYRKYSKLREEKRDETPAEARVTAGENAPEPVVEQPKDPPPKEINENTATSVPIAKANWADKLKDVSVPTGIGAALGGVLKALANVPPWAWVLLVVSIVFAAVYLIERRDRRAHERSQLAGAAAADPEKNNIYFK